MKPLLPFALLLAAGCAAKVYHPTKSAAEMQADIDRCSDWANHKYWMDPLAAYLNASDCLEELGYRKRGPELEGQVKQSLAVRPRPSGSVAKPCAVPCRRRR